MSENINNTTKSILNKFEIDALNPMQEKAYKAIQSKSDVVLLSPTGTGKTLAFLLPWIKRRRRFRFLSLFPHASWLNK